MDLDKPASPARLRRYTGPMTAQDSPHGPGERAELVHRASRETLGSPDASELDSPAPSFDLLQMVVSSRRLALLLEPLTDALEMARLLLGWRMPLVSLLVCLLLNTFLLTITEGGWLCVCLLGVATPAALGYLQDRCGGGATDSELQRGRYHGVQRRDLQTVRLSRQEAMLEVKGLLKRLDEMLYSTCLSAESVYKVLYWDDHLRSSRFYGAVLLLLFLLFSAPLGWLLVGLNSALFLWNRDFCRVLLGLKELLSPGRTQPADADAERPVQDLGSLPDRTPTPPSLEDLSPGSVEEAEEAEPDDEFKDAIEESLLLQEDDDVSGGIPDYDTISDNGLLSRNEPIRSKVSKLTEKLRKRYPSTNPGNCSSCAAVFSVLKKRRSCSNCGNSFCSRCCSFKVLRSSMGATAPEAQRETVFVCAPCNSSLNKLL